MLEYYYRIAPQENIQDLCCRMNGRFCWWVTFLLWTPFIAFLCLQSCFETNSIHTSNINKNISAGCDKKLEGAFPKILHQIWLHGDLKSHQKRMSQTCRTMYKDYEYRLWSDTDIQELIGKHYPWLLSVYRSYPYFIQKTDLGRYSFMHHFGGLYLDTDYTCEKPVQEYLANISEIQPDVDVILRKAWPKAAGNGMIVAKPKSPFLNYVLSNIKEYAKINYILTFPTVVFSTGPSFLGNMYYGFPCQNRVQLVVEKDLKLFFLHHGSFGWKTWDGLLVAFVAKNVVILALLGLFLALIFLTVLKARQGWVSKTEDHLPQ